jgi:hypothetical protein
VAGSFEHINESWGCEHARNILAKGMLASQNGIFAMDFVNFFLSY